MKKFKFDELGELGMAELSHEEMKEISGGWFWIILSMVSALVAATAAIIDYANQQSKS